MKDKIFKEAYNKYIKDKQLSCNHKFVDGYNVITSEAYKKCSICGIEKNRVPISEKDAELYLGVHNSLEITNKTINTKQLELDLGV